MNAQAGIIVVQKSNISFPQVWKTQSWRHAEDDGIFVQLESKTVRKIWFVPYDLVAAEEELPIDHYALFPKIIEESKQ